MVDRGVLRPDDYQVKIVQKLQDLHDDLSNYAPTSRKSPSSEGGLGLVRAQFKGNNGQLTDILPLPSALALLPQ